MDDYTPTTQPRKQKKRKMHGCLVGFLVFFMLVCFFFVFLLIVSMDDSEPTVDPDVSQTVQSAEEDQEPEPVFSPVSTTLSNWEISVNDYELLDSVDISLLYEYQANEGSQYCAVDLTAKNIGSEADIFLPLLAYGDCTVAHLKWNGYTFSRSTMFLTGEEISMESLNPLVSTSGKVVFEIPNEAATSDLPLIFVISAGEETFSCELIKQ